MSSFLFSSRSGGDGETRRILVGSRSRVGRSWVGVGLVPLPRGVGLSGFAMGGMLKLRYACLLRVQEFWRVYRGTCSCTGGCLFEAVGERLRSLLEV